MVQIFTEGLLTGPVSLGMEVVSLGEAASLL